MAKRKAPEPGRSRDHWAIEALESAGAIGAADAERLRTEAPEWVASAVIVAGLAPAAEVAGILARATRVPVADLALVEPPAVRIVPEALARLHFVLPLSANSRTIRVATPNPLDIDAEQMLSFATSRTVSFNYTLPELLPPRLDEVYRPERQIERLVQGLDSGVEVETLQDTEQPDAGLQMVAEAPTARLVDAMIADAVRERASDVHCEPGDDGLLVRYRVDGVLREVMRVPRAASSPVVRRIKVMGRMDVSDPLRPHDGRAIARVDGKEWDLRISSVPIARLGEKIVIRLLDPHATSLKLEKMGLWEDEIAAIESLLQTREGILLVTGPTGSGKTSTLYAALDRIRTKAINVVTVEDPVEYRLKGVNQIQVNERQGLTFATALRSVLRQDPDVVLLGEVRDNETAQTAWQAALSGHLVLSTLHTNDAATTIMRLADLGIEPYKVSAALKGILAQRLLRRICPHCAVPSDISALPAKWRPGPDFRRTVAILAPKGCDQCAFTGYRGRFAIEEILTVTPEVAECIASGATADAIADEAKRHGMRPLWEAGLRRVWAGETSWDEVARVLGEPAARPGGDATQPAAEPAHAAATKVAPVGVAAQEVARAGDSADHSEGGVAQPLVLIADDDPTQRLLTSAILVREGFRVAEAVDGMAALLEAGRLHPALILLDMEMPQLDGLSVLGALRATLSGRAIPVIVVTSKDDAATETRCIELGAEDFIAKPVREQTLVARIRAVLRRVAAAH